MTFLLNICPCFPCYGALSSLNAYEEQVLPKTLQMLFQDYETLTELYNLPNSQTKVSF